ncbi:DNA/RNA non-specific endonuclease [Cellulomonas pakistanensis]|uniref:Serine protease n=1 Tax=Cellulomonas pakistanensis TaxID=992287 RepID=A0A919PAT8_9CELL|nr:DNA/RNA non-specific endonuclease [Cellulomonas pakistanensis]GIG37590.1 hypothetical protein Cpa01nite_29710 [Cellulomonas pakistanensis]
MDVDSTPGGPTGLAERLRAQEAHQRDLAARRARERTDVRDPAVERVDRGEIAAANDPLRVARRVDRVSRFRTGEDPDSVPADAPAPALVADAAQRLDLPERPQVLLEKVVNQPDFLEARYLEGGFVAQRTVGRIVVRGADGRAAGYGTGFLVSARLLLTNHHVLPSPDVAAGSVVQLDFQRALDGDPLPVVELALDPDAFFVADAELDFALVAVAGAPEATAAFGWCRLTAAQGTVVVGESVTIVQHPAGRRKEVALRENRLVDIPEQVLHYVTDTEPGSSGSPVFNDQWEVVALHHASVPDPSPGGTGSLNEGIRISRILRHLAALGLDPARRALVDALDDPATPHGGRERAATPARPGLAAAGSGDTGTALGGAPAGATPAGTVRAAHAPTVAAPAGSWPAGTQPAGAQPAGSQAAGTPPAGTAPTGAGVASVEVPLRLTVSVALDGRVPGAGPPVPAPLAAPAAPAVERLAIDPDYSARAGYDPAFLGVPLPLPGPGTNTAAASAELRYHHFSVVVHRVRRLALYTAVNIDGARTDAPPRADDRWILDPRLPREEQTGADVYADNALDRGHLVRRLDPAWGPPARAANDDTFHYTNSAPQHHAFNAGSTLWLGLEEFLLGPARRDRLRISVVTGPVLAPDDPPYRGVLLPRRFWKLAAVVEPDGRLVVTGYVLGQDALLPGVLAAEALGAYRTFQVPVTTVADLTGLDLSAYAPADPLGGVEAAGAARELRTYAEIVLG